MSGAVLLDTGPLVSFLADESEHAAWVHEQWGRMPPPMLTCEPVLTEAAFLLKREGADPDALFELLHRKVIRVALRVDEEQADLRTLMSRYRDRPMSLADACLVRLSEMHRDGKVFTLDSEIYGACPRERKSTGPVPGKGKNAGPVPGKECAHTILVFATPKPPAPPSTNRLP